MSKLVGLGTARCSRTCRRSRHVSFSHTTCQGLSGFRLSGRRATSCKDVARTIRSCESSLRKLEAVSRRSLSRRRLSQCFGATSALLISAPSGGLFFDPEIATGSCTMGVLSTSGSSHRPRKSCLLCLNQMLVVGRGCRCSYGCLGEGGEEAGK